MIYFAPRPRPPYQNESANRPAGRVLEVSSRSVVPNARGSPSSLPDEATASNRPQLVSSDTSPSGLERAVHRLNARPRGGRQCPPHGGPATAPVDHA